MRSRARWVALAAVLAVLAAMGWHLWRRQSPPELAAAPDGGIPGVDATSLTFHGARFDVVVVDPSKVGIEIHWQDREGQPLERFTRLDERLAEQGKKLVFATNAGIFEPGLVPTGLLVERGATLRPLNLSNGRGNFYLRPNGVFLVGEKGAAVVEASEYPKLSSGVREATQSGPLLVHGGAIHPEITPASDSTSIRSGVGVRKDGKVVFAISRDEVNLWSLAALFRDELGCPDALYLDGFISGVYKPELGWDEEGDYSYAGMLAVVAPDKPAS